MVTYNVETAIGICECYEQNGVYYPVYEYEMDKFIGQDIISIERKENDN